MYAEKACEIATTTGLEENLLGDLLLLIPFCNIWLDCGLDPFADFGTEGCV